jgi:hypothetical protein
VNNGEDGEKQKSNCVHHGWNSLWWRRLEEDSGGVHREISWAWFICQLQATFALGAAVMGVHTIHLLIKVCMKTQH